MGIVLALKSGILWEMLHRRWAVEKAKECSTRSVGWQIEGVTLEEALQRFQVFARRVESTGRFAAEQIHQRVVLRMRNEREVGAYVPA
jgi:hypothetical protein